MSEMSGAEFRQARQTMGLTQGQLAERIGCSLRSVQDIENRATVRKIHALALDRVSLTVALEHANPEMATRRALNGALTLYRLIQLNH